MTYLGAVSTLATPQSQPILGSTQVANNAGGYAFPVDDWTRLERFLVLGSEGGTYYVGEQELTRQNAEAVLRCIQTDANRVVAAAVAISSEGRAPKNDPALFVLAMAASLAPTTDERHFALTVLPGVARTGTHLLHFVRYCRQFRGWGRGLRQAVAAWLEALPAEALGYQALKYQQRDGWALRDLLRLAHPKPRDEDHAALYYWLTHGWESVGDEPHPNVALRQVWAAERLAGTTDAVQAAALIRTYRLPREVVPTALLGERGIWEALADDMPMTALIRNLATMTRVGLLAPMSAATLALTAQLRDEERLRRARVHPLGILAALKTYAQGHGVRGNATWEPVRQVVDALDEAFYATFANVPATGKRIVLALDVSGSMAGTMVNGVPGLSAREACAAMALITAASEPNYTLCAFDHNFYQLTISPRQRLDDVVRDVSQVGGGGTNCALPLVWAHHENIPVDAFVILTDSETWQGAVHPVQAIRTYRQKVGIPAKLITVAMAANGVSIGDADDAGMMNCVGFDTHTPALIADFITRN